MQNPRETITRFPFMTGDKDNKVIMVYTDSMGIADSENQSDLISNGFTSCVAVLIFNTTNGERALIHIQSSELLKNHIDLFFKYSKGNS